MSGIDRSDQILSYHSGLQKTLLVHILEMMLINSFYLYRKFSNNEEFRHLVEFRENIIKNLMGGRKVKPSARRTLASFHYLLTIPERGKKQILQRNISSV